MASRRSEDMATSDELTTPRALRTRAALLRATRELIEERGCEAVTMAAVAERAGVTRRAVYLHFASRPELVAALFEHVVETEGLAASSARVWAASDSLSALDEWAGHMARFHPRVIGITRAIEQVQRSDPDAAAHRQRYLDEQLTACRKLAAWLERDGRLASRWTVTTAGDMLFGLLAVDLFERLLTERHWSQRRLREMLAVLLRETFVDDAARS
jgi:AcrR family transcriptional regulator